MAYAPIAFTAPNYRDNANEWIKAYEPGTTTPKVMALESNGGTQVAKLQLNADGFIVSAGAALVIPYLSGSYDLWLFPTEAEADANNTTDAIRLADNLVGEILAEQTVLKKDTLNEAVIETHSTLIYEGAALNIKERTTGNGGGAIWDVVLASSVTPNTYNIVACTGVPTLALVLRFEGIANITQFGAIGDGFTDNQPSIQAAIDFVAGEDGGAVYIPEGVFNVNSTIALPDFDTPTASFGDAGMRIYGASRNGSNIVTSLDISVFTLNDFYNFAHFSVQQRGTTGTGKAFYASGQIRFNTFYDINVISFKYGCLMRFTLWMAWRDVYFVGCTAGVRLSRSERQEDQSNPPAGYFWNRTSKDVTYTKTFAAGTFQDNTENWVVDVLVGARMTNTTQGVSGTITSNTDTTVSVAWDSGSVTWQVGDLANISGIGFFNNQLTFDNILCNGGEVGIWAACMGATFNNVTCQNQETDGSSNTVLPVGQAGTGMWLEGGGEGSTDSHQNTILSYYTEDTYISLKISNTRYVTVQGWFAQGVSAAIANDAMLWIEDSKINITAQTGSATWTNAVEATDSLIVSSGALQASSGAYNLTNSKVILDGIFDADGDIGSSSFPHNDCFLDGALYVGGTTSANTIRHVDKGSFTSTLTPSGGGTITLSSAADLVLFTKVDRLVTVNGRIDIASITTPTGAWMDFGTLPYPVNASSERAGNSGGGQMMMFLSGAPTVVPVIFLEGSSTARVYVDASTLVGTEQFYFTLNYVTTT